MAGAAAWAANQAGTSAGHVDRGSGPGTSTTSSWARRHLRVGQSVGDGQPGGRPSGLRALAGTDDDAEDEPEMYSTSTSGARSASAGGNQNSASSADR